MLTAGVAERDNERRIGTMAILVQYKDRLFDVVQNNILDELIASDKIIAFRRAGGWVDIDKGPLRGKSAPTEYRGPERRTGW